MGSEVAGFAWLVAVREGWDVGWAREVCVYDGMEEKGGCLYDGMDGRGGSIGGTGDGWMMERWEMDCFFF